MTPEATPRVSRSSSPDAPVASSASTLPFVFEDRTDGRYARIKKEVAAARQWTQRQRAQGFLPS